MQRRQTLIGIAIAVVILQLGAETLAAEEDRPKLIAATKHAPPFAIKKSDGTWSGVSIDLWKRIAMNQGLEFELREMELEEMLAAVGDGSVDVGVAALTITHDREEHVDFTHPFYSSGLGIAVPVHRNGRWRTVFRLLFSWRFLEVLMWLGIVLLVAGVLVWLFERRRNPDHFGGGIGKGLGAGIWWSAVTMTTVGYGDKAPKTAGGRTVAILWMFTAIILISFFTASVASQLTVSQLETPIQGPDDLVRVRVGTVSGSTSDDYLTRRRIPFKRFATLDAAVNAIAEKKIDAVVYDAAMLRYLVNEEGDSPVTVSPSRFEQQDYGFALPVGSELREPVSRSILRIKSEPVWEDILYRYMGR